MQIRQRALVILGLFISAVFLWVAFSGLKLGDIWPHIRAANLAWLLVAVGVFFLSMVAIAWRWGFLLRGFGSLPTLYLAELVSICYMGNNVYPLRVGEFLRIFLLQRDHRVPVARTTTTIFIERIFDGFVMLGFILIPLQFIHIASQELRLAVNTALPFFATLLLIFLFMALQPGLIRRLARWVSLPLPVRLKRIVAKLSEDVISGMESLRNVRWLAGTITGSLLTWLLNAAVYWLVSFAFGLDLSYWVMLIATGAVNLAGVLPASPGQIGVFEFFVSTVVIAVGVPNDLAFAYAVVVHLVIWLPPTLLGYILLARRGLGVGALVRERRGRLVTGVS